MSFKLLQFFDTGGVTPSGDSVTASVSNYRHDALMAFTESTDLIEGFYQVWEMYLYKNNIRATVFTNQDVPLGNFDAPTSAGIEAGGAARHELYHRGDLGATQARLDSEITWFNSEFSRQPSALSYALNNNGHANLLSGVFAGRNSAYGNTGSNGDSYFGTGLGIPDTPVSAAWIDRGSTTRIWETTGNETASIAHVVAQLNLTKTNNGWHNNFMHARDPHTAADLGFTDRYLSAVNSAIGADFVWRTSYGEAVEYAFLRNSITGVTATLNGNTITVDVTKNTLTDFDLVSVPITVRVDISGTSIAGSELSTTGVGIRKIATDVFAVDIAKGNDGQPISTTLTVTGSPSYYDFSLPSIVSATVNGSNLDIVTSMPTKVATWITDRGNGEETCLIHERSNAFQTSHSVPLAAGDTARDIYVSAISQEDQSTLSTVYQFA